MILTLPSSVSCETDILPKEVILMAVKLSPSGEIASFLDIDSRGRGSKLLPATLKADARLRTIRKGVYNAF